LHEEKHDFTSWKLAALGCNVVVGPEVAMAILSIPAGFCLLVITSPIYSSAV
jgi:hypothetical protein